MKVHEMVTKIAIRHHIRDQESGSTLRKLAAIDEYVPWFITAVKEWTVPGTSDLVTDGRDVSYATVDSISLPISQMC